MDGPRPIDVARALTQRAAVLHTMHEAAMGKARALARVVRYLPLTPRTRGVHTHWDLREPTRCIRAAIPLVYCVCC